MDNNHLNWEAVNTANYRIQLKEENVDYYIDWLVAILYMDDKKIETNTLNLTGEEIKIMAGDILRIIDI